jgi:hypothetical protein
MNSHNLSQIVALYPSGIVNGTMIVNKKMHAYADFLWNSISLRQIINFRDNKTDLVMKRIATFFTLVFVAGIILSSCGTQRQACAAYSSVEQHQPADNG